MLAAVAAVMFWRLVIWEPSPRNRAVDHPRTWKVSGFAAPGWSLVGVWAGDDRRDSHVAIELGNAGYRMRWIPGADPDDSVTITLEKQRDRFFPPGRFSGVSSLPGDAWQITEDGRLECFIDQSSVGVLERVPWQ